MVAADRLLAPPWQPRTPKPLRLPTILSSSPPFFLRPHPASRFRSSHHCAAHSFANFGIGTLNLVPNINFRRERRRSIVLAFGPAVPMQLMAERRNEIREWPGDAP